MTRTTKNQKQHAIGTEPKRNKRLPKSAGFLWRHALKTETKILILSIVLGLGFWGGDAVVDTIFFSKKPFLSVLLLDAGPYEIYMRTSVFLALVMAGIIAAILVHREKEARQNLQEKDARFQAFMDNLPGIAFMRGRDGRYVFVNRKLCETIGKRREDILGHRPEDILLPEEAAKVLAEDEAIFQTDEARQSENVIQSADGPRTWMASKFPISGSAVAAALVGGVSVDITDRKRAEEALRDSEEQYRTLFNNTNDGILLLDMTGTIIGANDVLCERLGYSLREMTGMHVSQIDTPEYKEKVPLRFAEIIEKGHAVFETEHVKRDGTPMPVEISTRVITYAGQPAMLSIVRDISERRAAEKTLHEAEELYRMLVENLGEGVGIVDPSETFVFVNPAAEAIFGVPSGGLTGRNLSEFTSERDFERALDGTRLRRQGTSDSYEMRIKRPDGAERILRVTVTPRKGENDDFIGALGVFWDITDASQARDALRVSEERYRTILDDMEEGYYEVDLDGKIIFANEAFGKIWGIRCDELIGRNFRSVTQKETADRTYAAFHRVFKTGKGEWITDWRTVRADGSVRFLELSAYPIAVSEKRYSGFRGVIRDVTDRLAAEQALRESEERYRDLVENSVDVILTHDLKGTITSCNPATARFFGLESPGKVIGMNLRDVLVSDVKDQFQEYLDTVHRDGRAEGSMKVLTMSGDVRILAFENTLSPSDSGDAFVRARAQDVTEKMAMEKALRQSEVRYRKLFERSLAGMYKTSLDGRVLDCNMALAEIFGADSVDEVKKISVVDHYANVAERKKFIDRLKRDGRVTNMELTLLKMDKSPIRVLMSAALVQGEPGEGDIIEGTFIDITEKEALASEKAKARELQGISQLTSGIAHEVRNPLFAIQLNLAGLVRRLSLDETEQTQVDFVLSHVKRLDSLVRSLLELGQSVEPEEMIEADLRALIKDACIAVEEEFPSRSGQIDIGVHETPVLVRVSPRKITQAFVHLLRNAVQVTPEGGAVHIRCDHDASGCRVLISDEGPGIPGKIRKSLFEPFVTTRTGQPGMGLALARHYIESHGGTISAVNNKPPPGATFAAWLPTTGTLRDSGGNKLPLAG